MAENLPIIPDIFADWKNTEEEWGDLEKAKARLALHKVDFFSWFYDCFRTKDEGRGLILPPPKWEYLYWIHHVLTCGPDDPLYANVIWVEKSRQQFVTHFMTGYCLWLLLYDDNKRIIYGSKNETQVKDVIRTRFESAYYNYPDYIPRPDLEISTSYIRRYHPLKAGMKKPLESMILRGMSSSGKGSRGDTSFLTWLDEIAELEEQESLIKSSYDSTNAPASKMIGVTTGSAETKAEFTRQLIADSIDPDVPVRELSRGVRAFRNTLGHLILQIDYDANPTKRSQEWYDSKMKELGYTAFMINHGHMWEVPTGSLCYWAADKEKHARNTLYDPRYRLWIGVDPGSENGVIGISFHQIINQHCKVLDGFALEGAGLRGAILEIEEWLEKNEVFNFRIIIDPAGAVSNPHGLADNSFTTLQKAFPGKVGYCKKSKPEQRIQFTNTNLFQQDLISIPTGCGVYRKKDGTEATQFYWKSLLMYSLNKSGKPIKDNKHDHLLDALSYAILASYKPDWAKGFVNVLEDPLKNVRQQKAKIQEQKKKRFLSY